MADKRIEKRESLKQQIIELAEARIAKLGLTSLRARDLAEEAGCALGSLYNMFADLDGIVLAVNGRTLDRLEASMQQAMAQNSEVALQLKAQAQAYLEFARSNALLWRALFEHYLPRDYILPEWFISKLNHLMDRISVPLGQLQPRLAPDILTTRARTLFAAVHGIVSISLDNRFIGLRADELDGELARFVELLLAGQREVKAQA